MKYPDKSNSKRKFMLTQNSREQFILAGRLRQEIKTAGHMTCPIRKYCSASFLHLMPDPSHGTVPGTGSINTVKAISHWHFQRPIYQVVLESVKLTINTSALTHLEIFHKCSNL